LRRCVEAVRPGPVRAPEFRDLSAFFAKTLDPQRYASNEPRPTWNRRQIGAVRWLCPDAAEWRQVAV